MMATSKAGSPSANAIIEPLSKPLEFEDGVSVGGTANWLTDTPLLPFVVGDPV